MIIESIIGGITLITLGSIWFVDRLLKREDEPDPEPEKPKVWIEPFAVPDIKLDCPKCGVNGLSDRSHGPLRPVGCDDKSCEAYPALHVHVSCGYCKAKWFRAARIFK